MEATGTGARKAYLAAEDGRSRCTHREGWPLGEHPDTHDNHAIVGGLRLVGCAAWEAPSGRLWYSLPRSDGDHPVGCLVRCLPSLPVPPHLEGDSVDVGLAARVTVSRVISQGGLGPRGQVGRHREGNLPCHPSVDAAGRGWWSTRGLTGALRGAEVGSLDGDGARAQRCPPRFTHDLVDGEQALRVRRRRGRTGSGSGEGAVRRQARWWLRGSVCR